MLNQHILGLCARGWLYYVCLLQRGKKIVIESSFPSGEKKHGLFNLKST